MRKTFYSLCFLSIVTGYTGKGDQNAKPVYREKDSVAENVAIFKYYLHNDQIKNKRIKELDSLIALNTKP